MPPHFRPLNVLRSLLVAMLILAAVPARAADEEATRIGGVDVVVWTPSSGDREPSRGMFSHALYMCPGQSSYLTRALADAGYLVIAPRHADSSCSFSSWPSVWRISGKPSPLWTDRDYRDRADDIRTVLKALPEDPRYRASPIRIAWPWSGTRSAGTRCWGWAAPGRRGACPAYKPSWP